MGPVSVLAIDWFFQDVNWLLFWTVPLFTGTVGWLINWTGLIMLFSPLTFHGKRVPGMRQLASVLPRKVQEVPGIMQGGLGWQGIIPARAAKMGSIAVDKAIAKLGTPAEFYQQLEPDQIAAHIVETFHPQVPEIVDQVMSRERPDLWRDLPTPAKRAVYHRVQAQLPQVIGKVTDEIGIHIDQLLDPKLMVIDHFEKNPDLVVRIFRDFGQRELNLMVNFGFIFGFLLGIPLAVVDHWFHQWWILPVFGVVIGWVTNKLGMWLIYSPAEKTKVGPFTFQGLFPKRQDEAAEVYAEIIAEDVINLENIGRFITEGPRSDRTKQMMASALRPAIDRAAGPLRGAVRVAVGEREFDAIRESVTLEAVDRTIAPFQDEEFGEQQAEKIRKLISDRTKELPATDFVDMMRSAIEEDEWLLYAHGAVMGLAGGFLHLLIFGVGASSA
ncbi:hypothetical protein KLP28_05615 [Nocardioidaceae bacterium]|nr:hypothetical protein KLP28_05615 [Nocardioidaceae bacterium]